MKNPPAIISIIIPLYNNEAFIARAIESCIHQTFKDFEIIIVDDGSSDNSLSIAQNFANTHEHITLIVHECNQGTFKTRITGAKEAQGKYLCFLDSDDYFTPQALEILYNEAQMYDADIVYANYYKTKEGVERESHSFGTLPHLKTLHEEQIFKAVFDPNTWTGSRWTQFAKLYQTNIIKQSIQFLESLKLDTQHLIRSEDLLFTAVILYFAKTAFILDKPVIFYNTHEESTTKNKNPDHQKRLLHSDRRVIALLQAIHHTEPIASNSIFAPLFKHLIAKTSYEFYANQRKASALLTLEGQEKHSWVYLQALSKAMLYGKRLRSFNRILCYMLSFGRIKK